MITNRWMFAIGIGVLAFAGYDYDLGVFLIVLGIVLIAKSIDTQPDA